MIIPDFTLDGMLPVGDYEVNFQELRQSILVQGPSNKTIYPNWDVSWRSYLVDNFEIMVRQLISTGLDQIFLDGSFSEDKDHPNDIDGYFVCPDVPTMKDLPRRLNLLDPHKIWTWDPMLRTPYRGYPKKQLPMWHQYRVELYPHVPGLGLGTGIQDRFGNDLEFPAAFRQSRRNHMPKGIVKIKI